MVYITKNIHNIFPCICICLSYIFLSFFFFNYKNSGHVVFQNQTREKKKRKTSKNPQKIVSFYELCKQHFIIKIFSTKINKQIKYMHKIKHKLCMQQIQRTSHCVWVLIFKRTQKISLIRLVRQQLQNNYIYTYTPVCSLT